MIDTLLPGNGYEIEANYYQSSSEHDAIAEWCKTHGYTIEFVENIYQTNVTSHKKDVYRLIPPKE